MKPKPLRETLIRIKLKEIDEGVTLVREHLPSDAGHFRDLGLVKDGIYKRIEFAIEDVYDICAIINTDLGLGIPGDDDDIITHLVHQKIISPGMEKKVHGMKGFRNIAVHRYGTIDDTLACQLLKENIGDFSLFILEIEQFLKKYH